MRVLHIINNLGSGGAESMLINFFRELKNSKDYFEILLLIDDVIAYKNIPSHIKITVLSNSKKRYSIKKVVTLYRYIKKNSFDVVHSHLFPTQYYVFLSSLFLKKKPKLITTEHNTTNTRRKYWILKQIDKIVYRYYDHIIFISDGVAKQFENDFGNIINKGLVIKNGIPLDKFLPGKKNHDPDNIKIIMVARFTKQKDHLTLLRCMKMLDDRFSLSLVGEGELKEESKKYVQTKKLENKVHFLGFRNDISTLYQEHDIFVLSSHWEGFGLVAIEAMASSLPVIASQVDGLSEVVKDAGLLFKPGDPEDLKKNILKIVSDHRLKSSMITSGLQRAKSYDIKSLVDKTIKLYKDII